MDHVWPACVSWKLGQAGQRYYGRLVPKIWVNRVRLGAVVHLLWAGSMEHLLSPLPVRGLNGFIPPSLRIMLPVRQDSVSMLVVFSLATIMSLSYCQKAERNLQ